MIRWLTYRCLGISFWVYLLGLVLAGLMFWVLPPSNVVFSWKFENYVRFEGFSRDHRRMVITEQQNGPARFHHLNVETGELTTYAAKDHPDEELDFSSILRQPKRLSLEPSLVKAKETPIILERADNSKTRLNLTWERIQALEVNAAGVRVYQSLGENDFSMTLDNRWLMLQHGDPEPWRPVLLWLKQYLSLDLSDISDGYRYSARILDLKTSEEHRCHLRTLQRPTLQVHPAGTGFAAFEIRESSPMTVPTKVGKVVVPSGRPIVSSTINWYHLPPGRGYLTLTQWAWIAGAFLLPIMLAMLIGKLRSRRQQANSRHHAPA